MSHWMTPPPALVQQLLCRSPRRKDGGDQWLIEQAYAAGADAELEASSALLADHCAGGRTFYSSVGEWLYDLRRPAPRSPQQKALDVCSTALATGRLTPDEAALIRLALEAQS